MSDKPLYDTCNGRYEGTYHFDVGHQLTETEWQAVEAKYKAARTDTTHTAADMAADCGGVTLVRFPMRMANCSARALVQLLCDLENIEFAQGFCARDLNPSDDAVLLVHRGGWTNQFKDFEVHGSLLHDLTDEILSVLSGEIPRVRLREYWPHPPRSLGRFTTSLDEAKWNKGGSELQVFLRNGDCILRVPAHQIRVTNESVNDLATHVALLNEPRVRQTLSSAYAKVDYFGYLMFGAGNHPSNVGSLDPQKVNNVWIPDHLNIGDTLDRVKAVLNGTRDQL